MTTPSIDPYATIHATAARIARGELDPRRLIDAELERIGELDGELHAFVEVYADAARQAASAAGASIAAGHRIGPLHGIPIALKDIIEWRGRRTSGGSAVQRERISETTPEVVERLPGAGSIVLGKTHTVECAFGGWGSNETMGMPRNPWDRARYRAAKELASGGGDLDMDLAA